MKKIYNNYFYRSEDFEKVLVLHSAGCILDSVEWDDKNKIATFLFEDEDKCLKILDLHKRKKLMLDSTNVLISYREIKNELFNGR